MKSLRLILIEFIKLFLTGCENNKLEEGWNGFYKSNNNSNYYIQLYTKDNVIFNFNVIEKDGSSYIYSIQYKGEYFAGDNTLEYIDIIFDNTVTFKITKNGNEITITASSTDPDSPFNNISGTYTKYKNATSENVEDFH